MVHNYCEHDSSSYGTRAAGLVGFEQFGSRPENYGGEYIDWNRNWSSNWSSDATGAGPEPFSAPEMKQFGEFLMGLPSLCGVLGYHSGSLCLLRPPSSGTREEIDTKDNELFEQIAQMGAEKLGVPSMCVTEMRKADAPRRDYHGHSLDCEYDCTVPLHPVMSVCMSKTRSIFSLIAHLSSLRQGSTVHEESWASRLSLVTTGMTPGFLQPTGFSGQATMSRQSGHGGHCGPGKNARPLLQAQ